MKRSPMPRRTSPLPRGKKLLPRSTKRIAEDQERTRQRREAERVGTVRCEGVAVLGGKCMGPIDWHERLTRARGGSITDPTNRVWLCRCHHMWVTEHPREAEGMGLMCPSR